MSVLNSAVSQSTTSSWFSQRSTTSRSKGRSQEHWKLFRKDVLAPHHIRIVASIGVETIPESICTWVEANRDNVARFDKQRIAFRNQVANGRGFGSSVLFPQEVLPSNDARPFLARCMVPTLSADALPEKVVGKAGAAVVKSSLSLPRPGLGCGFSRSAFAPEEISCMPAYMLATGTTVHFDTGSIQSGSALYCPFFSYERVFSQNESGLEIAANQCAIDGAWSVRALQMLYAKALDEDSDADESFPSPISFTCAIDNNIAVINYHWVDHAQTYCMAPVIRFELSRDDHFNQLMVWTEAIGQWALSYLLPDVKKAINLFGDYVAGLPALQNSLMALEGKKGSEKDSFVSALKLSYDNIPWRYENETFSPVSSSTASWGSPMINEAVFAKFSYPIIQPPSVPKYPRAPRSVCSDTNLAGKEVRFAGFDIESRKQRLPPALPIPPFAKLPELTFPERPSTDLAIAAKALVHQPLLNPGEYTQNNDLLLQKRLGHAMDEIQDLQTKIAQLKEEMGGSNTCIQHELSGLRKTMTSVLRKERVNVKPQSRAAPRSPVGASSTSFISTEHRLNISRGVSVMTTPTDPRAQPVNWHGTSPKVRIPSGLQNVLSLDTNIESVSTFSTARSEKFSAQSENVASPITIFSPTIINMGSAQNVNSFDAAEPQDYEDISRLVRIPNPKYNMWSEVAASHLLSMLMPSTMLRVIFLGCLLDYCMMSMHGRHSPSMSQYVSHLLGSTVF